MGFYLRKSVKAGPFRFNLSKSGLGLSMGIRGLRIGTGPRGHYVHAGVGGFYYRSSFKGNNIGEVRNISNLKENQSNSSHPTLVDGVQMVEIESGDVLSMREETAKDLIDEINSKSSSAKLSILLGLGALIAAAVGFSIDSRTIVPLGILVVISFLIGKWIDSFRRCVVVLYQFDDVTERRYANLVSSFEQIIACKKKWHIPSGGTVGDLKTWKRKAGATHLVSRFQIEPKLHLPEVVRCNFDVPFIPVGKQSLFFFPDFLLVLNGKNVGAVGYTSLNIRYQSGNFIETEQVPSDAEIVSYTWKHPNKSGGPDRRFKNNQQIPVCLYEEVSFESPTGLKELVQLSRHGVTSEFKKNVTALANSNQSRQRLGTNAPSFSARAAGGEGGTRGNA